MSFFAKLRSRTTPQKKALPKHGLIGLDVSNHSLHLCQLRPEEDNKYTILAKSSIGFDGSREQLFDSPKEFKRLLVKAIRGKKFKGRKVTVIMPPDEVKIMLLSYKANHKDVDAEVIRMLSQRIDGDIDDYVIDYLPVRNNSSDEEHIIMASVARRDQVDRLLSLLSSAGLEVHSLDIGPATLRRLISTIYSDEITSNVLIINTDDHNSYLTIVSGRRLLFDQSVSFGCLQLVQEIASSLEISIEKAYELVFRHGFEASGDGQSSVGLLQDADVSQTLLEIVKPAFIKLVEEINRVLVFTASETHGIPLSRVCLFGCISRWPGAQNLVMSLLDIKVPESNADFYQVFLDESETTEPWLDQLPELAIATGLALRGLKQDA